MSWLSAQTLASSVAGSSVFDDDRRASTSLADPAQPMKRTASMCSLPSPPADGGDTDMDIDLGAAGAPRRPSFGDDAYLDTDEVDQLESDDDDASAREESVLPPSRHHGRTKARPSRPCLLGSPAVLFGRGGAALASRKQLLNPFLPPVDVTAASSASSASTTRPAGLQHGAPPPSPSASPVRPPHPSPSRRRHRPDPDRIRLTTPPPRPSAAEVEAERERAERSNRLRTMGWEDPENPFVERDDTMARRLKEQKPMQRPETITYVKRGQRIKTSVPFSAVLTSSSPSDDPFTFTAPKLLFPPAQPPSPTLPSTPPRQSKFLEALRAAGGAKKDAGPAGDLPPTPATLKRKVKTSGAEVAATTARGPPQKRARTMGGGDGAEYRGLR